MNEKECGNCGWDGETPLDSGDLKMTEPVWGKMGEWIGYKQDAEWDTCKGHEEKWDNDLCYKGECEPSDSIRGCLVFYIDVGQLPPVKAEAYVDKMKQQLKEDGGLERIKKHREIFFIPVRSRGGTRVEYIAFN